MPDSDPPITADLCDRTRRKAYTAAVRRNRGIRFTPAPIPHRRAVASPGTSPSRETEESVSRMPSNVSRRTVRYGVPKVKDRLLVLKLIPNASAAQATSGITRKRLSRRRYPPGGTSAPVTPCNGCGENSSVSPASPKQDVSRTTQTGVTKIISSAASRSYT